MQENFLKYRIKRGKKHNTKKYCKEDKNEDKLMRQKTKKEENKI